MKSPIYNGLMKYISKRRVRFSSPGHKGKVKMSTDNMGRLDTGVSGETDEILNPYSFLKKSEEEIAGMFGADKSFYLTAGIEGGIFAVLSAICKAGDKIIVDPECDKAVINAITVLALIPVFIKRSYNSKYNLSGGIDTEELEYLTERHRDAKAVFISSPTYTGVCANIRKAAEIAHGKKMLLIVDESLGAHFNFSKLFPDTALECGADVVFHSCSQTLGAFSGSGLLHLATNYISEDALREQLSIYQGGSDSFAFLCATENAIWYAFRNEKKFAPLLREIEHGKYLINRTTDVLWFDAEYNNGANIDKVDAMRIVLNFSKVDIKACDVYKILINKYGIEPEGVDCDNLIFSVSLYNTPTEVRRLINACVSIAKLASPKMTLEDAEPPVNRRKVVKVLPYKAFNCEGEWVELSNSSGRLCRRLIYKSPNGTPIIVPGEKINQEHITKIADILNYGGSVSGLDSLNRVEVLSLGDSFYM